MNFDLMQELLIIAISCGTVMTLLLQKIKEGITVTSQQMIWLSFMVNLTAGVLFTMTFSSESIINGVWVGLFSFIGADLIYRGLEDRFGFKSLSKLNEVKEIKRDDI